MDVKLTAFAPQNQTGKKDLQINAELGQTVYIYNIKVRFCLFLFSSFFFLPL